MFKQEKELEVLLRQEEMENDEEEQVDDGICEEVEGIYNEFEARQYIERLVAADERNEYDGINREEEVKIGSLKQLYLLHMQRMIGCREAEKMIRENGILFEGIDIDVDNEENLVMVNVWDEEIEQVEENDASQEEEVADVIGEVEDKLITSQEDEVDVGNVRGEEVDNVEDTQGEEVMVEENVEDTQGEEVTVEGKICKSFCHIKEEVKDLSMLTKDEDGNKNRNKEDKDKEDLDKKDEANKEDKYKKR